MPSNAQSQTLPNPFRAPAAEYLDREQPLDAAGAIALLGRRRRLHTIELGFGICGADMDRKALEAAIESAQGGFRCRPGTLPRDLGHHFAIWRADVANAAGGRRLFVEVKKTVNMNGGATLI